MPAATRIDAMLDVYQVKVEELLRGPDPLHAGKTKLYSAAPETGSTLTWDYNFDEAWTHGITVEKIRPMKAGDVLPRVVDGKMAAPPVGCGGMLSYRDMVKAIADSEHEQRAYWMARTKGEFDPKAFSVAEANERMRDMQACYDGELA